MAKKCSRRKEHKRIYLFLGAYQIVMMLSVAVVTVFSVISCLMYTISDYLFMLYSDHTGEI